MIEQQVCIGNIKKETIGEQASKGIPLYLGSGDFGGCFDEYGMMSRPYEQGKHPQTVFMHADFWHRGNYGHDYHLPAFQLRYENAQPVLKAEQELHLYDGCLQTTLQSALYTLRLSACFHPYLRDVFALEVEYEGNTADFPQFALTAVEKIKADYDVGLDGRLSFQKVQKDGHSLALRAGNAQVTIQTRLVGTADWQLVWQDGKELLQAVSDRAVKGRFCLLVGVSAPNREPEVEAQLQQASVQAAVQGWHRRWGDKMVSVGDAQMDALFVRSVYGMLCSFSPAANCIAPPTGWTGNAWAFHFPQDFSYILPVLLQLGHVDIAKAKMEYYHRQIGAMNAYSQRIFGNKGALWAWEFPIGDNSKLLQGEAPNWYQFEIHNSAYPARMAYETAQYVNDPVWSREIAWEIIKTSADFYDSLLRKEGSTWGIQAAPSMGQDELGGENAKNYLCALYAAQYTLQTAVKLAQALQLEVKELAHWQEILADGLAFDRLVNTHLGIYQTYETAEENYQIGKMKHPIQLMPFVFLPMDREPDVCERKAWEIRYTLCDGHDRNFYHGWTLVDLMLADVKMGDWESFEKDFHKMVPSVYADADYIQIYETSTITSAAYYITSHGLYAQAILQRVAQLNALS